LLRREEGALLLSGKRGVGKSSFVFSTLHEAIDKLYEEKGIIALPVLVNAPNFEIRRVNEKGEKIKEIDLLEFKRIILQNLVRRLYQTTRFIKMENDKIKMEDGKIVYDENLLSETNLSQPLSTKSFYIKLRKKSPDNYVKSFAVHTKIHELFMKAVAKEVKKETNLEELEKEQTRIETKSRIELSIAEKLVGVASSLVSSIVIALANPLGGIVNTIIALLTAIIPSAAILVSWERTKSRLSDYEQQKRASTYYHYDYDVSTLQSEFEDKLRKLSQLNYRVIFIIDELDKMDYADVINVIKSLKTLFNQASALFILISGEEFFRELAKNSSKRPTEYTLFPQKIFLQRPQFNDVHMFIDGILMKPSYEDIQTDKEYEEYKEAYYKFQNYLCYASKTDYFDLYNTLRNYIKIDELGPRLNIRLDEKAETPANLQIALEKIYIRKKLKDRSDWYKNDLLLDKMYDLLTKLAERKANTKFLKIEEEPQFRIIFLNESLKEIEDSKDDPTKKEEFTDMEREALTDFINYLARLNFLSLEVGAYKINGILKDVPSEIKTLTKEENEFINQYGRLQYILTVYFYLYNNYVARTQVTYNFKEYRDLIMTKIIEILPSISTILLPNKDTFNNIHDGLTQDIPKWYEKETLEQYTKMINDVCDAIFRQFITLLKVIVSDTNPKTVDVTNYSPHEFEEKLGIKLSSDAMYPQNLVIESKPYKKQFRQLLIVQNAHEQIIKEIQRIKNEKDYFFALILSLNSVIPDEIIRDPERQIRSSLEYTSHKDIWFDRLVITDILRDRTFASIIDVVLSWIYDVEEIEDKDVADWIEEGDNAVKANNYESALSLFDKAIDLDPKAATAWYNKGRIYFRLKNYDEAIRCYDKALEIDSTYRDVLYDKALALYEFKKYNDTLEVIDKAITSNLVNYNMWFLKGMTLFTLGQYDEALRIFDKAIDLDPKAATAWYNKGRIYFRLKNYDEAIRCYDKVLEISPRYAEALSSKGVALNALGRYKEAIECFDTALENSPQDGEALYGRAVSYAKIKNARNAIADLRKAIKIGKDDDKDFYRKQAIEDINFENIRESTTFRQTVGLASKFLSAYDEFQVTGHNAAAPFTLKLHCGEGMTLLAMNWKVGKPPQDFVGFAIEYKEPNGDRFYALKNRLGFRAARGNINPNMMSTMLSPIQKFRWVHFPRNAELPGEFIYRVTPVFMNDKDELRYGETQEAAIELRRETYPGFLSVTFTRGFVSSQAFVDRYASAGLISKLLPGNAADGLNFVPTHPLANEALKWMGFEAFNAILEVLDKAITDNDAKVRVVAYELNEPEIVSRLEKLGDRLKIIIDDSQDHGEPGSGETQAATQLSDSAGTANVKRQHMSNLQHNKTIVVDGPRVKTVVCGSTNFSWRGFFVQSNNALILQGASAVEPFLAAFEDYWSLTPASFRDSASAKWSDLGLSGIKARVTFSPHGSSNVLLKSIADDIGTKTTSSLFFSLAFLYQTPGVIRDAIRKVSQRDEIFVYGISDREVGGLDLQKPDGNIAPIFPAALTENVPKPFSEEPTGGGGTRMHHKFVVIDFDKPTARVYLGSYNFSSPADTENGENLLLIRDRRIAISYVVEALRIFDHYHFRLKQQETKKARKELVLAKPPRSEGEEAWWAEDYTNVRKIKDRELFA
jgi:tetratricopeptide (TPR) repeat protein/phosphatidylserine/phosphatidylglycerophosphate/cardiolipin synthase-like enzyme